MVGERDPLSALLSLVVINRSSHTQLVDAGRMATEVFVAGSNSHHQLGHPSPTDVHHFVRLPQLDSTLSPTALATGANHSLLLAHDPAGETHLLAAGANSRGQLDPSSSSSSSDLRTDFSPLPFELLLPDSYHPSQYSCAAVAACWESSFILLRPRTLTDALPSSESDLLLSLGANDWGERGIGGTGTLGGIGATAVSFDHLLRRGESEYCVEKIKAGPRHILALLAVFPAKSADDAFNTIGSPVRRVLVAWGASRHGQLGTDLASPGSTPRLTSSPQPVVLPTGYTADEVVDFALGKDHTVVLLEAKMGGERRLWLIGSGKHGQLGPLGSLSEAVIPPLPEGTGGKDCPNCNFLTATSLLSSHPSPAAATPYSHGVYGVTAVGCTWNGTYVVLSPQRLLASASSPTPPPDLLFAFGSNSRGQLGYHSSSDPPPPRTATSSLGCRTPAVVPPPIPGRPFLVSLPALSPRSSSSPSSTYNTPTSPPPSRIVQLACGSEHVLVRLSPQSPSSPSSSVPTSAEDVKNGDSDEVWGWGWNEHGNLGLSIALPAAPSPSSNPSSVASTPSDGVDESSKGLEDVLLPRRVWSAPTSDLNGENGRDGDRGQSMVKGIWAGMATSWISVAVESYGREGSDSA